MTSKSVICSAHWSDDVNDVLTESSASWYFVSSLLDFDPEVHFYWRRGERIIPKGHRRGHLEPTRFQIDDRPNSQIRITQQLPQVQRSGSPQYSSQARVLLLKLVHFWNLLPSITHVFSSLSLSSTLPLSLPFCTCVCSSLPWRTRMLLRSQRSHWLPT